ncbi:MAG: cobalamin-dependent protein [Deltaproteobacteria bacterium]|nr:cobalamin-dependent protein [Deltaproteobacteria bacterium]
MKIALIAFGNEESYGLLFVGGELLCFGQEIRYFDAEMEEVVKNVADWQTDFIFFSPMTTFFPAAYGICKEIKKQQPEVVSVFGGHHATAYPKISEMPDVDVVVVGPVRGSIEKILGGEKGIIKTSPTTPGDLPMPARKEYYRDIPRMMTRYRKVMLSMLGCPWNCSYCSSSSGHMREIFGIESQKRYFLGRRPLDTIIAEAKEIKKYDTAEIEWVDDDMFCGPDIETWIPEFVSVWEKEIGIPMYISTTSHYVLKVSDNVLATLRRMVTCIGLGIQAIRPRSLRLFNRSWDNESKMKAAYDRLTSFGYAVNLQCIIGLPVDEPVEDALDTIKGMQRIGSGSIISCYPLQIYPGTAIEKYCIEKGFTLNDACAGDTNTGIPGISFPPKVIKQIKNICKLATLFVKYGIDERWMRVLIDIDFDDQTSRYLSAVRYYECVTDRLGERGEQIFNDILKSMHLRH